MSKQSTLLLLHSWHRIGVTLFSLEFFLVMKVHILRSQIGILYDKRKEKKNDIWCFNDRWVCMLGRSAKFYFKSSWNLSCCPFFPLLSSLRLIFPMIFVFFFLHSLFFLFFRFLLVIYGSLLTPKFWPSWTVINYRAS